MIRLLMPWPVLILLATAPLPADAPASGTTTYAQAIRAAEVAAAEERWGDAAASLARARSLVERPEPVLAYDQAVAAYRAGDLEQAAKAFEQAMNTDDPELASAAAYNLGNTAFLAATRSSASPEAQTQASTQLESAKQGLLGALDHYRTAIARDRLDVDARANGELTWQRLKEIQRQQQEQQEQQQQQQQDQTEQSQNEQDQQQEQPQEQSSQDQQQPSEDQQQQEEQDQQSQQQQQQQSQEERDQQSQQQQQQQQQQEEQDQRSQQQQDHAQTQNAQPEQEQNDAARPQSPGEMSRDDAERKLQAIRDRERQRRREKAEQEAAGEPTTGKDW